MHPETTSDPRIPPHPAMTLTEYYHAVERLLDRLDLVQRADPYARVSAQQVRDLLDPDGLWKQAGCVL